MLHANVTRQETVFKIRSKNGWSGTN